MWDLKPLNANPKNGEELIMITESDIFVALFVALLTGILAVRLGVALYS
jgi:photosystem I reaction center subunit XII